MLWTALLEVLLQASGWQKVVEVGSGRKTERDFRKELRDPVHT